jgi:tRNA(Ile)-lysidine synthase
MDSLDPSWFREASKRKRYLLGVSGGLDSMALLYLMHEHGFREVVVCHLDHGLRGEASIGDARLVGKEAERLGFTIESEKLDLRVEMLKSGESLETAGRLARHDFFAKCARKWRCKRVLLAHHMDDQAETILWNLMRGSHGCRGMSDLSELKVKGLTLEISRPLLGIRKADLQAWMESNHHPWREDESNRVNDVVRNRIRNEALPLLNAIAKRDVGKNLVRAARNDQETRAVFEWALEKAQPIDPQGRLHLGVMRSLPPALQAHALLSFLKSQHIAAIDHALLESCLAMLSPHVAASVNLPGNLRLRRRAGRFFIE